MTVFNCRQHFYFHFIYLSFIKKYFKLKMKIHPFQYISFISFIRRIHTQSSDYIFFIIFVQKYLHATSTVTRLETTSPWLETATHWQENSSNTSITWLLFNSNLTSLYRLLVFSSNPSFSSVGFIFSSLQRKNSLVAWAARQLRFPVTSLLV